MFMLLDDQAPKVSTEPGGASLGCFRPLNEDKIGVSALLHDSCFDQMSDHFSRSYVTSHNLKTRNSLASFDTFGSKGIFWSNLVDPSSWSSSLFDLAAIEATDTGDFT